MSPSSPEPLVITRAQLRRWRPGRGPARLLPLRFVQGTPAPEATPARTHSGRYLYTLAQPLLLFDIPRVPAPRRPAPLADHREVG
jgi:hypothetical protein